MAFNLQKIGTGEKFSLKKSFGLDEIRVELTWEGADLDIQAWLLSAGGTIVNDEAFVFYNSENRTEAYDRAVHGTRANYLKSTRPMSADGAVLGAKDEVKGGIETINITLSKVDAAVNEILISATIYEECGSFSQAKDAKVTIIDEQTGDALCSYELTSDYQTEDACVIGRFVINNDGEWEFNAMGDGYNGGLQTLVEMYT